MIGLPIWFLKLKNLKKILDLIKNRKYNIIIIIITGGEYDKG